jgi:membrane protein implicated in regulation of membrane protease activity
MVLFFRIPLLILAALVVFIISYVIWAHRVCRNLEPSKEKLNYGEALTNETHHLNLGFLWVFEILSI